jgi:prepilin signal peptidase PulO-like enzyme (type II secretory pathway)
MWSIFIFLFGLAIGSFLNVVIFRLEKQESVAKGRSYCPHCKHTLAWFDLIPVVSFLVLGGKCRYCRQKISWQYPIVELLTGLVFVIIFRYQSLYQPINISLLFYIASSLIVIFVYDLKFFLIPDIVLFPAIVAAFLYRVIINIHSLPNYLLAAIIFSGFFLCIYLFSKGAWMGFGDVKLAILLGLLLGLPNLFVGMFLSFFFGAIIGVVLLALAKKGLKSEVPFAPFLITGTSVALIYGQEIVQWYLHFFTL